MDNAQTALMAAATSFGTSTLRTDPAVILHRADVFLQWLEDKEPDEDEDEKRDTALDAAVERAEQDPPNKELHAHHRDEPTYGDDLKRRPVGFQRVSRTSDTA